MKRCLDPADLRTLLQCSADMPGFEVVRYVEGDQQKEMVDNDAEDDLTNE